MGDWFAQLYSGDIEFEVALKGGRVRLQRSDFEMGEVSRADGGWSLRGTLGGLTVTQEFTPRSGGVSYRLTLEGDEPLGVSSIDPLIMSFSGEGLAGRRVPCAGRSVMSVGLKRALPGAPVTDSMYWSLFADATSPCPLVATIIPQKNNHLYTTEYLGVDSVRLTATTRFTAGQGALKRVSTETMWLYEAATPLDAIKSYAGLMEPASPIAPPAVGWNSWDYYFGALRHEDIMENVAAISADPALRQQVKYIVIDMGWEHVQGEWYANYRFPKGMAHTAACIREAGYTPGIWVNGVEIAQLSYPAMRRYDMFVKNEYGDPQNNDGMFMVDPTHPDGHAFLHETFSRLHADGYRLFKVDFVSCLQYAHTFYKQDYGPYDALRELFSIIREAVTEDSHIIGCSFPVECGAGYVDSSRIGVDIHNQWGHVEWIVEFLQLGFWQNGVLYRSDPDFLVVRGGDTSLEAETNVLNPYKNAPVKVGDFTERWRRGEVFSIDEARTWANIVRFAGGNVFLGDRISMLNDAGRAIIDEYIAADGVSGVPLDLGDGEHSSYWLRTFPDHAELLIINYSGAPSDMRFDFGRFGIDPPGSIELSEAFEYQRGELSVRLNRHASAIARWTI